MRVATQPQSNPRPNCLTTIKTTSNVKPGMFVLPFINKEAHKTTLDNYREWINFYNRQLKSINNTIATYNTTVQENVLKNPPSETKKVLLNLFATKHNSLKTREYNKEVEIFNNTSGLYVEKRKLKKVKPNSILFFEAFLHAYTVQIRKQTAVFKSINKQHATTLPKLELNPHNISKQKRNGNINLDYTKRSIRAHKQRLEEAGVLIEKDFKSRYRPVDYFINPKILVVFDEFSKKSQSPQNQASNVDERKNLQHIKVSTRTETNKIQIKENVDNSTSLNMDSPSAQSSKFTFYKSTQTQDAKAEKQTEAQNVKVEEKVNQGANFTEAETQKRTKWLQCIEDRYGLAQKIASGAYNFYAPISTSDLNKIKTDNVLTDNEFRELALQDFIKTAAKLNAKKQAFAESWGVAIKYLDTDFGCINFKGNSTTKDLVYSKLMEFRYRLNWSLKWFKSKKWEQILFASSYFDPSRDLPSDVSWQYTKKVWSKKLQKIEKGALEKQKRATAARKRKKALSEDRNTRKQLDNAIYKYLRKEYDLNKLTSYVASLPKKQQKQFPDRLQELTLRRIAKSA